MPESNVGRSLRLGSGRAALSRACRARLQRARMATAWAGPVRTKGSKKSQDLRPRKFLLDHARERLQRLGPVERPPVDKEGRRAVDAEPDAFLEVALHRRPVGAAGDAALERRHL